MILFVIIARAPIMRVYVSVPVEWHFVLRSMISVYFINNQRAQHRVLLLNLCFDGCLLSNLSCVCNSHSLVCLHWDRISSLNPHTYPIEQALLCQFGSERDFTLIWLLSCLVRCREDHADAATINVWNLNVFGGNLFPKLVAILGLVKESADFS